jgi:endonuclease G
MKRLILLVLLPLIAFGHPVEIHNKHWKFGLPEGTDISNDLIIRDAYALSSNDETEFADWVAYKLTPEETYGDLGLNRPFKKDPFLDDDETLNKSDYVNANTVMDYEKGHQAPLGSFVGTHIANQTNFFSNISPQVGAMNGGPWKNLESKVRKRVVDFQEVWVITGPIFEAIMPSLPHTLKVHMIPSGYFKIVYIEDGSSIRAGAFIMGQDATSASDLEDFIVSIDDVETRSGLTLFPDLIAPPSFKADEDGDWVIE